MQCVQQTKKLHIQNTLHHKHLFFIADIVWIINALIKTGLVIKGQRGD